MENFVLLSVWSVCLVKAHTYKKILEETSHTVTHFSFQNKLLVIWMVWTADLSHGHYLLLILIVSAKFGSFWKWETFSAAND